MHTSGEISTHIFGDVKGPFERQVGMIVVVNELGDSLIMPSGEHTRRCFLRRKLLLVRWLVGGVWRIASDHFLILADADAFALDDLDIFQAGQHVMLNLEDTFHTVFRALLDGERLRSEGLKSARG